MNTNENKNIGYEIAKGKVAEYIAHMDAVYEIKKEQIKAFENEITDEFDDEYFNYWKSVEFVRTWEIIKYDLNPAERNLVIAIECAKDYNECLSYFNGTKAPKNVATLRTLICNARNKIRYIYNQLWGD